MKKKKTSSSVKNCHNQTKDWVPASIKPLLHDTEEIKAFLLGFDTFTPHKWNTDDLIEWIGTTLRTSHAKTIMTDAGFVEAEKLFSVQRMSAENWALSRPGWWDTFEKWRERNLQEYFIYEPPKIAPDELPLELESWWRLYIKEPLEPNPRRRCAYLVAAAFLPTDFSADDLVVFAATLRRHPSQDTTHTEWDLTDEGNRYLISRNEKEVTRKKRKTVRKVVEPLDIASTLGVNCWEGLIIELHQTLIRVYAKGSERVPKDISFDEMGLKSGKGNTLTNSCRLLIMLGIERGKYNPEEDVDFYGGNTGLERFKQDLFRLNESLRCTFGLKGVPVSRSRKKENKGIVKTLFNLVSEGDEKTYWDSRGKKKMIAYTENNKNLNKLDLASEEMEDILTPTYMLKHNTS